MSLGVAVVVVVLWVRSYRAMEGISRFPYFVESREYRQDLITSSRGVVVMSFWSFIMDESFAPEMARRAKKGMYNDEWRAARVTMTLPEREHWWEGLGLYVRTQKNVRAQHIPGAGANVLLALPYWVMVVLLLIGPGVRGVGWWRRRRRFGEGKCERCGYD